MLSNFRYKTYFNFEVAWKGLTGHKFSKLNSGSQIKYYLHEVSQKKYSNFWNKIAPNCIHDDSLTKHDLVASFFTLEHCLISDIEKSYLERVNKKGVIILTVPNLFLNGRLDGYDHINHFTSHNLESLFSAKFSEKFNFAISKELYPRSLTILLSLISVLSNLRNFWFLYQQLFLLHQQKKMTFKNFFCNLKTQTNLFLNYLKIILIIIMQIMHFGVADSMQNSWSPHA